MTYSAQNLPTGAKLTGNSFSWTPAVGQAGTYSVTFTVSDGSLQASQTVSITVQASTNQDPRLVSFWKFDETSGTLAQDSSGKGNVGTLVGATWIAGKLGNAVNFTAVSQAVNVKTAGMSASSGTVSLWAYPTKLSSSKQFLYSHATQPWSNRIQLYLNNGRLVLGLGDSTSKNNAIQTLSINTWYHVALTWNAGAYNVYVNGALKATGSYTGLATLNSTADIGNNGSSIKDEGLLGRIDQVKLFNQALTAADISALYTTP